MAAEEPDALLRIQEPSTPDSEASEIIGEQRDLDMAGLKEELAQRRQDREERKKYAHLIFRLVVSWLLGIAAIVLLQGFLGPVEIFEIPTSALVTLIGGTTASVVAIFGIVAKHIFPPRYRCCRSQFGAQFSVQVVAQCRSRAILPI